MITSPAPFCFAIAGKPAADGALGPLTAVDVPLIGYAEAHAEIPVEGIVRDDDARLDEHLAHRNVERRHQLANAVDGFRGVTN